MAMKHLFYILLVLISLKFISCEKIFLGKEPDNTPENNFKFLWQQVEMKYSFFDIKDVRWDSVYYKYSPLISDNMSQEQLFDCLAEMLYELKDGHVNLYSLFKTSHYDFSLLGPVNINFRIIKENYLNNNYEITGPFIHGYISGSDIGYIRYASFSNNITEQHFQYMLNKYKGTKGLVFDIRQNGGGYIENVFKILSRFLSQKTLIYYTQIKTGYISGPNDTTFGNPVPVYVVPSQEEKYTGKVIVLTDRGSYSASSFFTVACHAIPNMYIIGDTTGGGLGLPTSGQLPNGWIYRFPITRTISVSGKNWENGVPPDIYITMQPDHNVTGVDDILEEAILMILND